MANILQAVCVLPFGDGLTFDPSLVRTSVINEAFDYPGVTGRVRAALGPSQVDLLLDVSFGNVITPGPVTLTFPPLLLDEAVRIVVYPLETIVTEKFAALVEIGAATTRMKDLYDLHAILTRESFDAALLREALHRSFAARGTPQEAVTDILSETFAQNSNLDTRFRQYLRRTGLSAPSWQAVMTIIGAFYGPVLLDDLRGGTWDGVAWRP